MTTMTVTSVSLPLLLRQKQAVLRSIECARHAKRNRDALLLEGVLNLLDAIHDQIDPPRS
jgi:hypothetical protein